MLSQERKFSIDAKHLTPAQWKFFHTKSRSVLLSGGFGSGKTTALMLKLYQLKCLNPRVPGLVVAQSWRAMWSIVMRTFEKVSRRALPWSHIPKIKDKNGECFLDFGDGVPVFLRSAKNPDTMDGLNVGWALGDELRHWPKQSFDVFMGRVRVDCPFPQVAFSSTPAMNFMADEFNTQKKDRELIIAPTGENSKNLAPGFIDNLRLSYSRRLQRAVIEGEFTVLEGSVFESFDSNYELKENPWFIDYDAKKFPERKTYMAVDPGYRKSSWLLIHEAAPCDWIVYDQFQFDNTSTSQCVEIINSRGIVVDELWCDPAADNTQGALALDDIKIFRMLKFRRGTSAIRYISDPYRSIEFGVEKLRVMLGDPDNGIPIRLRFARTLAERERKQQRGIVKDLAALRYPEVKDGRPITNVPVKDGVHDHAVDSLRYWSVGMWLTSPLRKLDKDLLQSKAGWKNIAA